MLGQAILADVWFHDGHEIVIGTLTENDGVCHAEECRCTFCLGCLRLEGAMVNDGVRHLGHDDQTKEGNRDDGCY